MITKESNYFIVKLHTSRTYNRKVFKNTIKIIWKPTMMIRFHEVGFDTLLVDFESKLNKEHVIHDSPWNFNKNIVLLKEYDGKQKMSKPILI